MNNVAERALKTFVEAFVSSLVVVLPTVSWSDVFSDGGYKLLISAVVGCIATAISVVWNGVIDPILKNPKPPEGYLGDDNYIISKEDDES